MTRSFFKQDLSSHFEKIESGRPIHFKRFLLGLAELGVPPNQVERIFDKQNVGKKRYKVRIRPEALSLYKELRGKSLTQAEASALSDKVAAARYGRSHSKSASGAYALIHTQEYPTSPFCIVLDSGIPRELPKLNRRLLLIENMELFLRYQQVMKLATELGMVTGDIDLFGYDVMYSQGSVVLNKQYKPLLMAYDRIDCLFDLDFGGIVVYSALKREFKNARFLLPRDCEAYIDRYGFDMPKNEVDKLHKLASETNFSKQVKGLIRLLTTRRKKLEQEVYLITRL